MTAHACFICDFFLWAIIITNTAANWHCITNAPGMKSNKQITLTFTETVSVHTELKRKWEKYWKRWSLRDCKGAENSCIVDNWVYSVLCSGGVVMDAVTVKDRAYGKYRINLSFTLNSSWILFMYWLCDTFICYVQVISNWLLYCFHHY